MQVTVEYLRRGWGRRNWLFSGQHGFIRCYSYENQAVSFLPVIDLSKASDLVPHHQMIEKLVGIGLDRKVVHFHCHSESSGVPQSIVIGPLLFSAYVSGIWVTIKSKLRLFGNNYIICCKIKCEDDMSALQRNIRSLETWTENIV